MLSMWLLTCILSVVAQPISTTSHHSHTPLSLSPLPPSCHLIKRCSALTPHSKKQVLQAIVLCYLDYCPVVWSSASRKDLVRLQLAQNRAARLALHCNQRADINTMHASLSWLRVEEWLTASETLMNWKSQIVCTVNLHTGLTHTLTPDMPPRGFFFSLPQIQNKFKKVYSII